MADKEMCHLRMKRDYLNILVDAYTCTEPIVSEIERELMMEFFIKDEEYEVCEKIKNLSI